WKPCNAVFLRQLWRWMAFEKNLPKRFFSSIRTLAILKSGGESMPCYRIRQKCRPKLSGGANLLLVGFPHKPKFEKWKIDIWSCYRGRGNLILRFWLSCQC